MGTERIPPSNNEAEQGLLGCLLAEPAWVADAMRAVLPDPSELFFDLRHRNILATVLALLDSQKPTTLQAVVSELEARKFLVAVGGYEYVSGLLDGNPSSRLAGHFISILADCASLRRLIAAASQILADGYENAGGDVVELLGRSEERMLQATRKISRATDGDPVGAVELVCETMRYVEDVASNRRELSGFWLDDIGAWLPGNLVVLAALPGVGKTTLGLNIVANACKRGIPCGIVSMEMPRQQLVLRMASAEAGVDVSAVYRKPGLGDDEHGRLADAFDAIARWPLCVDDRAGLNVAQIRSSLRRMSCKSHIAFAVVDYLQLVDSTSGDHSRNDVVGGIAKGLKKSAKELGIPILAISQVVREVEKMAGFRDPRMSDMRDSGMIENCADVVVLAHYKPPVPLDVNRPEIEAIVAKNRNGRRRRQMLVLKAEHCRFCELIDQTIETHASHS